MAAIPARLGRYRLLEHVASGGMADVFRAKSVGIAGFEKILAIKLIRPNIAQEPRFIRSFIDEARIAVTLNHRNIVQVFDFGKAEHRLYLAMELIEGIDLRTALNAASEAGYEIPAPIACYIVADLAAGLDYAHRKADAEGRSLGIVHCDVSPHNVMLSYEGFIKILDFGVARARFAMTPEERRLRGKPRYMAPEQTRGEVPTPATDSFALGIVAWELFTGLPLFEGADVKEILRAVRRADTPAVRKLNPDVPRYLSDAIDGALRANPEERVSVAELSETAARAARELATVASSRALADWLALIRPGSADIMAPSEPSGELSGVESTANVHVGQLTPEPVRVEAESAPDPATRTNIIIASDLAGGLDAGNASNASNASNAGDAGSPIASGSADESIIDGEPTGTDDMLGARPAAAARSVDISAEVSQDVSGDVPSPIAEKLLREKRHVVATCALFEGGDPELGSELTRLLAELAYKRGAVIQDQTDSSLVVVFGLEVAGEDDVASAMQYSLDATELARETNRDAGADRSLAMRLGSRAGIVAQRRSDGIHIRGSGLDDARALARAAEPGRPLLSGGSGRLASAQFAFRELPTRRHGSRRLRAFELVGPRSFEERARVLTERRGRFVGRRSQLGEMNALFEQSLAEGRRLTVALIGAGGVGKSRLVAEFVARHPDTPMIAVAANQTASAAPFSLIVDLLQSGLDLPPGRGEHARAQLTRRLRGTLEAAALSPPEVDAAVATLSEAMEYRDGALLRPIQTSAGFRERVTAAFRKFRNATVEGSVLVVIENLHWADAASLEVLRALGSETADTRPGLHIITTRPADQLEKFAASTDLLLEIGDLEDDERDELIRDRLGGSQPADAAALVAARAGGNPLLIEEVCTAVREFGHERVPATARDIVLARVDALPVPVKTALQHASVAGPTVRSPILEELLGPHTPAHLGELIEEGLLVPSDFAAERGDASELRFRHGLLQEVVYGSLSATGRKRAHRELGALLAARSDAGRDERPAEVATHLELGGAPTEAARFWHRAGKLALAAFDAEGARRCYDKALHLTEKSAAGSELRINALLGRESAEGLLGDHDAQAADQATLMGLAAGDPTLTAEINWRTAKRLLRMGNYAEAITATEAAETAARTAGDERIAAETLLVRGEIYERTGEFVKGLNAVTAATELFGRLGHRDGEMRSLVVRGRNCLTRSRYRAARDAYEPVLEQLEREPDPFLERIIRNHLAVIELCCGDFESAMKSSQRSLTLCEELGDRARVGDNLSVCGIILMAVGAFEEAKGYLDRGLAILEETKSRWSICDCKLYTGMCATMLGDVDGGIELLEASIAEARELGARYVLANALTEHAGVLLRRGGKGDDRAAEAATREAHEVARDAALVGIEILALSRHAEATVRLGNTMSAVALSTRAVDLLAEQDGIEGSEEEVYYTHCQLLRRTGDEAAESFLALARDSLESKLARLTNPEWRKLLCENLPVNAAILLET